VVGEGNATTFIALIALLFNKSLITSCVPSAFKQALMRPLLKIAGLAASDLHADIAAAATQLRICVAEISQWMSANRLKLNTDKTELLWAMSRQFQGHGPTVQLGADTVLPCDHVRLLGVIISADLSLNRHASAVRHPSTGFVNFDEFAAH